LGVSVAVLLLIHAVLLALGWPVNSQMMLFPDGRFISPTKHTGIPHSSAIGLKNGASG
jgi:hypothetical protein